MITRTEFQVFSDAACTQQTGVTVTVQGKPQTIDIANTTIGEYLAGGNKYYARVRATANGTTSDWSAPLPFITLIDAQPLQATVDRTDATLAGLLYYDHGVTGVNQCGFIISTTQDFSGGLVYATVADEAALANYTAHNLNEGTDYWFVPYSIDMFGRWWNTPYENAIGFHTGYKPHDMNIGVITVTNSYIGGAVKYSGAAPVTRAYVQCGQYVQELNDDEREQEFGFANGKEDSNGNTIQIFPGTEYTIYFVLEGYLGTETVSDTVMTADNIPAGISIGNIDTSARTATINIEYNYGINE